MVCHAKHFYLHSAGGRTDFGALCQAYRRMRVCIEKTFRWWKSGNKVDNVQSKKHGLETHLRIKQGDLSIMLILDVSLSVNYQSQNWDCSSNIWNSLKACQELTVCLKGSGLDIEPIFCCLIMLSMLGEHFED